ncbi:MAG: hypothetical protein LBP59_18065, partial [Planctomycetaceae bacterium]|nr:hypothetical protein [Planctomycetaceae bacterium]
KLVIILLVLEIQRFKSVKACRPKARQAKVNANSSTNSLEGARRDSRDTKDIFCNKKSQMPNAGSPIPNSEF